MEQAQIDSGNDLDEIRNRIRTMCCSSIGHWKNLKSDEQFYINPLPGGITNTLFRCWTDDEFTVVVRIFGEHSKAVICRESESEAIRLLAQRGFGKEILAEFSNGRIEEWISGRAITLEEMRNEHISAAIASRMAALHKQIIHTAAFNPRHSSLWDKLQDYADKAAQVRFESNSRNHFRLHSIDISRRSRQLQFTKRFLMQECSSPIVFCHNDLLNGNIVIGNTEAKNTSVRFIDFEYAFYNFRGFEIANHFCELCGFECDYTQFPNVQFQKAFAQAYLAASNGEDASDYETRCLLKEALPWVLASHLFWGFWGVIQASTSAIDFDYLEYAQKRFDGFDYHCSQLQIQCNLPNG